MFSTFSQVYISRASNLSLSYINNVQVSDPYNAALQTILFIAFFSTSLLIIFEWSSILLLNAFLVIEICYWSLLYKSHHLRRAIPYSETGSLAQLFIHLLLWWSRCRLLFFSRFCRISSLWSSSLYFHAILLSGLAQRVHNCLLSTLLLSQRPLIVGKLHIL